MLDERKLKSYIYDKNPIKFNQEASESIDFNSKGQFMTLDPYDFATHPKYDNNEFEISSASDSRKLVLNDIQKLPVPLEHSQSMSTKGTKELEFKGF